MYNRLQNVTIYMYMCTIYKFYQYIMFVQIITLTYKYFLYINSVVR